MGGGGKADDLRNYKVHENEYRHSKPKNTMFKTFSGNANLDNCCKVINNSNTAQAKM